MVEDFLENDSGKLFESFVREALDKVARKFDPSRCLRQERTIEAHGG